MPAPLALLLLVGAVLAVAWSVASPPLQGFDEPDHVAYAAHLAETGSAPSATTGDGPYSRAEAALLGPLGYGRLIGNPDARPPWQAAAAQGYRAFQSKLPASDAEAGDGPNPLAKNPPLYYAYEAVMWKVSGWLGAELPARLQWLRLWSGLLFLGSIACAWGAASELFRRTLPRVVAVGFVALQPIAGHLAGSVNSDTGLMLAFTALVWLALRLVRLGPSVGRVAGVAAVCAAAVLTHGRGLAAVPVLVVAVLAALLRHRPALGRALGAVAAGVVVLVVGLLAYRAATSSGGGGGLYGGEVNLGAPGAFTLSGLLAQTWRFYLPGLPGLAPRLGPDYGFRQVWVETWFAGFGAYTVRLSGAVYSLLEVTLVGTLLGGVLVVARGGVALLRERWAQLAVLLATAAGVLGLLHAASYRALVNGSSDPLVTGRYLLPLTVVVGLALGALVAALGRRSGAALAAVVLAGMVLLSLGGLAATAARFYA